MKIKIVRRSAIFALLLLILLISTVFFYSRYFSSDKKIQLNSEFEKEEWREEIKKLGAKQTYQQLVRNSTKDRDGHRKVHVFGEVLYDELGTNAITICDSSLFYGCYHGVFLKAIKDKGIEVVSEFDDVCSQNPGLELACEHGVGHGLIEYYTPLQLTKAVKECETLQYKNRLGGCQSGVFMGYNVPVTISDTTTQLTNREFDPDDPYSPCDALNKQYKPNCYFENARWWETFFQNDFAKVGKLCEQVPDSEYVKYCYFGIGVRIANKAEKDITKLKQNCNSMPDILAQIYCRIGGSLTINLDNSGKPDYTNLCDGFSPSDKNRCMEIANTRHVPE